MKQADKYWHASIIKNPNILHRFPSFHHWVEDDARKTDRAWDKSLENFANKDNSREKHSPAMHKTEVQQRWRKQHPPDLCLPWGPQAYPPTLSLQRHFVNRSKPQISGRQPGREQGSQVQYTINYLNWGIRTIRSHWSRLLWVSKHRHACQDKIGTPYISLNMYSHFSLSNHKLLLHSLVCKL